jgi:hypothetical protein
LFYAFQPLPIFHTAWVIKRRKQTPQQGVSAGLFLPRDLPGSEAFGSLARHRQGEGSAREERIRGPSNGSLPKAQISAGNPAASTRSEFGPLYLRWHSTGIEAPEELSLWEAIVCAPRSLRVLSSFEFDARLRSG